VTADPNGQAELGGAALDHAPGIDAVHSLYGQTPDDTFCSSDIRKGRTARKLANNSRRVSPRILTMLLRCLQRR